MGGGTGANLEFIGPAISQFSKVYVVDLASSLLKVSDERAKARGWDNVVSVTSDATIWQPEEGQADVVTFSYSLTMIPDWFAAIENAMRMLRPGGVIGVVDFYIARKHPAEGRVKHSWFTRNFWPVWFSNDNVFPSADHLPFLQHTLPNGSGLRNNDPKSRTFRSYERRLSVHRCQALDSRGKTLSNPRFGFPGIPYR